MELQQQNWLYKRCWNSSKNCICTEKMITKVIFFHIFCFCLTKCLVMLSCVFLCVFLFVLLVWQKNYIYFIILQYICINFNINTPCFLHFGKLLLHNHENLLNNTCAFCLHQNDSPFDIYLYIISLDGSFSITKNEFTTTDQVVTFVF